MTMTNGGSAAVALRVTDFPIQRVEEQEASQSTFLANWMYVDYTDTVDYLVKVRAPMAQVLYPECKFLVPMTRMQMERHLNELWQAGVAELNSMHLKEYGGALEYRTPRGRITAHSITGSSDSRWSRVCARLMHEDSYCEDHVLFEAPVSPDNPLYDVNEMVPVSELEAQGFLEGATYLKTKMRRESDNRVNLQISIYDHTIYIWALGLCLDQRPNGEHLDLDRVYANAHMVRSILTQMEGWM